MTVTFVYPKRVRKAPIYQIPETLYCKRGKGWKKLLVSKVRQILIDTAKKEANKKPTGVFLILKGDCPLTIISSLKDSDYKIVWTRRAKALLPERFRKIIKKGRPAWQEFSDKQLSMFTEQGEDDAY